MHRILLVSTLVLFILSCANNGRFEIIDSYGKVYDSTNITSQLRNEYGLEKNPRMLLLLTKVLNNGTFEEQLNILKGINAEDYNYIHVIGCPTERDESGYSLKSEEAAAMLSGDEFQIRIYDELGSIIELSKEIMTSKEIKNHLTKSSSGR